MLNKTEDTKWLYEIKPKGKFIDLNFKEIWRYRDLLVLFIKRDIVTVYKQTVLGPLWYLIQPLFTSVIFTLVFNNVAGIKIDGAPSFLFNLAGITLWTYFKECLTNTSVTFATNAGLFGKVYFPRVISPLSRILSGLFKYGIQLTIFIVFFLYYLLYKEKPISVGSTIYLLPIAIATVAMFGLGVGMILSAFATKYRDVKILISFGMQLLLYLSAVMYPLSLVKEKLSDYAWVVEYNPIAQVIEAYRYMLLNVGQANMSGLWISFGLSILFVFLGLIVFNKTEKTFIDTV
ncbi:ABC transporter permease [uncultured Dokdonia sp.]|uniref:ABC transporter permease n=1 Tax=uncultured Dokdonia sp. TaxID=575653 RepID=UPI002610EE57|nr:ABC transporter permease [uncultured Dokdonia sp.]